MNCETSHSGNYIIYTDGSYKKYNSGNVKASCAYIVLDDNHEVILKGKSAISDTKEKLLNSVGVELFSVIIALKALRKIIKDADKVSVTIMTDYQELERLHHLLNTHRKSSYKNKEKQQIFQWNWYYSNLCQVFKLYKELGKELILEVKWCRGHAGIFWNEKADSLAKDVTKKRGKEKRRTKNKIIDIHK